MSREAAAWLLARGASPWSGGKLSRAA